MKKEQLREKLAIEVEKWSSKSFDELSNINEPIAYNNGVGKEFYQVEVSVLEKEDEYLRVVVMIDDGGWRSFKPMSHHFKVFKDGRVEK